MRVGNALIRSSSTPSWRSPASRRSTAALVRGMKVHTIEARIEEEKLKVVVTAEDPEGLRTEALLPARETAALLPREILTSCSRSSFTGSSRAERSWVERRCAETIRAERGGNGGDTSEPLANEPLASDPLLPLMNEILGRLTVGREVRMWEYGDAVYCSFLRWRKTDVRRLLSAQEGAPPLHENTESDGNIQ